MKRKGKKEMIINFVLKNYSNSDEKSNEVPKKFFSEISKLDREKVRHFLKKSIGPNEKNRMMVLSNGEFLLINQEGNILGPS